MVCIIRDELPKYGGIVENRPVLFHYQIEIKTNGRKQKGGILSGVSECETLGKQAACIVITFSLKRQQTSAIDILFLLNVNTQICASKSNRKIKTILCFDV